MTGWHCALELGSDRAVAGGSRDALVSAIEHASDLRVYTEFFFEEHIAPGGDGIPEHDGLIREVIDFRETMVVNGTLAAGIPTLRSIDAIEDAQLAGREIKIAIRDLCSDLGRGPSHEVFSSLGSGFFHAGMRLYDALTHPILRVAPAAPLEYRSFGWDVAWVH